MTSARDYALAPRKAPGATEAAHEKQGRVMASHTPASLSTPAAGRDREPSVLAEIGNFWRLFFVRAFDPYRPELHYMRGPGPACRAKQKALSPAVQSMVAEIRAAKAHRSPAPL
jgi:hypothetical protein